MYISCVYGKAEKGGRLICAFVFSMRALIYDLCLVKSI